MIPVEENEELPADALMLVNPVNVTVPMREGDGPLDMMQRVWETWSSEVLAGSHRGQVVILRGVKPE